MKDRILQGNITFDGKGYCLDRWVKHFKAVIKPATVDRSFLVLDNSINKEYMDKLNLSLGGFKDAGAVLHIDRQGMGARELLASCYNFLREEAIRHQDYLFTIEADVYPPPDALLEMYNFMLEHPNAGVVGCQVGYPNRDGDDGALYGFRKFMTYRFLQEGEQEYDEIEAIDNEAMERLRPRIYEGQNRSWILVANQAFMDDKKSKDGKMWYTGQRVGMARSRFRKAMGEFIEPMKLHRIPRLPPMLPVKPDLEHPARVEGLHLCCTLIRTSVLKQVPFRWDPKEDFNFDIYFYQDLKEKGIEVWTVPLVCWHEHREWGTDIKR